jgi:hypothetical protein
MFVKSLTTSVRHQGSKEAGRFSKRLDFLWNLEDIRPMQEV